ncbi:MAG: glutamyl-tRNA reductase [Anaerolineales bacterium]|jgi:glutamyl-tRNA reductase
MHIHCLGINHTTASVSLRERLAFNDDTLRAALSRLGCGGLEDWFTELVILSTCNRIELYAVSNCFDPDNLKVFLSEARGVPADELTPHLYHYRDEDAIRHIMRVASGLDSLVLGEPQILGQVTTALEQARGAGSSGPLLSRLFQRAIHAGKRARTETHIARNPASVSSLAASLAEKSVHNLTQAQVVVLGAGEMAELAVEALRKRGAAKVLVLNRTLERADSLAKRWQAKASTFERLDDALLVADVLVSSTGAPHSIINPGMVKRIMETRPSRPLVMIDIAVPRDVDPGCNDLPGVAVHDIDSLYARLEHSLAEREAEVPLVEAILNEEASKFMEFFGSLDMLPLIAGMRQLAEAIRQAELNKTLRRLPDLDEAGRARIEALTQALVKKLLDTPTNCLRAQANTPSAPEYADVARTLFGLSTGD